MYKFNYKIIFGFLFYITITFLIIFGIMSFNLYKNHNNLEIILLTIISGIMSLIGIFAIFYIFSNTSRNPEEELLI